MSALFGTDGIRGVPGVHPLDAQTLHALSVALAELVQESPRPHRVLLGRDTRLSGSWIERLISTQLTRCGVAVASARVVSTPAVAHITREWGFSAGVVISASHNPARYNGVKILAGAGTKLDDDRERRLESRVEQLRAAFPNPVMPVLYPLADLLFDEPSLTGSYVAHLRRSLDVDLRGMEAVVDCAHGANWHLAPRFLGELGLRGTLLGVSPDGQNINDACGALFPEAMCRAVRETGAEVGICFDGDGDRVILADERGQIVDGDHVLYLLARFAGLKAGDNPVVVGTVMSNVGLEVALGKLGWTLLRAPVGDRFVHELMVDKDAQIGGEQSGHIILRRFASTGDGLLTALQVLALMRREKATLSRLLGEFRKFPQVLVNVQVNRKPPLEELDGFSSLLTDARTTLGAESRILVRYSGTEPLARVMVEGPDDKVVQREADRLAAALKSLLT